MTDEITIWIIEDNEHVLGYLNKYINQSTELLCTNTFTNCEAALAALDHEPAPHILLIDLGLPGMNGIEGIREFKKRVPDIEPLVFTIDDSRDKVFEAIQAGASGYLLKTAEVDEIVDACKKIARGEASLDGNIAKMMLNAFRKSGASKQPKKKTADNHNLTERELEILQLLADGYYIKEIVDKLGISRSTVSFHCNNLYKKLHASSQRTALAEAHKRGIL